MKFKKAILYFALACSTFSADFKTSVEITLKHEGSKIFKTKYGELSKFGITKEVLNSYNKVHKINISINKLTREQAINIYKERYWKSCKLDLIKSQVLANHIFDFGVNSGIYRSTLELQKLCNNLIKIYNNENNFKLELLDEDGIMGTKTINATNILQVYFTESVIIQEYKNSRLAFLKRLGNKWDSYGKSWTNRIENI